MQGNQKGEHGAWHRACSTLFSLFNAAKCKFIWRESQSAHIHLYLQWLIRSGPCQEINTKPVGGINTHDPSHHVLGRIINCPTSASGEVWRFQQIIEEVKNLPNHILDKTCRNAKKNATKTNFNTFRKKVQCSGQRRHLPLQPNRKWDSMVNSGHPVFGGGSWHRLPMFHY